MNVSMMSRPRRGTSSGSESAAANETTPRIPAQDTTAIGRHGGGSVRRRRSVHASQPEVKIHADHDHDQTEHDGRRHDELTDGRVHRLDDRAELQPDEGEYHALEAELDRVPRGPFDEAGSRVLVEGRAIRHHEGRHHHGEHAGRAQFFGRQECGERRHQ
jgi:hypothetical protein